jgi:hypothetical protein
MWLNDALRQKTRLAWRWGFSARQSEAALSAGPGTTAASESVKKIDMHDAGNFATVATKRIGHAVPIAGRMTSPWPPWGRARCAAAASAARRGGNNRRVDAYRSAMAMFNDSHSAQLEAVDSR